MSNHISQEDEDKKIAIAESLGQVYEPPQHQDDWSKRTDFTDVKLIGYLSDGEVMQGDLLRQKPGKIFVHFGVDAELVLGHKYGWISLPNARICPPPKNKPKNISRSFIDKINKKAIEEYTRQSIQRKQQQSKILVAGFIKDQEKKQISRSFPGLQPIIAHYCCLLIYGLPIISNWKTICNVEGNDWSKRTDFTGVTLIGYLCPDGEVIHGCLLRQQTGHDSVHGQISVDFSTYAENYGNKYKYDWISIPNERICPPPKNKSTLLYYYFQQKIKNIRHM